MSIISQETWDNMPDNEKELICKRYSQLKIDIENLSSERLEKWTQCHVSELEAIFGKENLQPEPKIRTWKDVCKQVEWDINSWLSKIENAWIGYPIARKMIATAKIAKLIELGYGGIVTEEEWKEEYKSKWVINCAMCGETRFEILEMFEDKFFIAFHEESQAEEFMSYPENRALVEQYNMI